MRQLLAGNGRFRFHFLQISALGLFLFVAPLWQATAQTTTAEKTASDTTASADKSAPAPTATLQPEVVSVLATVRDKKGRVVTGLTQDDFSLTEEGHAQNIRNVAKAADQPMTIGLLIDTAASQWHALDPERSASGTFLEQVLREKTDKAFIIHFDHEVELAQDLTASRQKLEDALASLHTAQNTSNSSDRRDDDRDQQRGGNGGGYPGGGYPGGGGGYPGGGGGGYPSGGGHRRHGGAMLYDAVYLASDELMKKQSGRKALIVFSDGVDRDSKESLSYALETAQRSNTIVYAILFKGEEENEGRRGGFGSPGMGGPGGGGPMGRRGGGRYPEQESRPDGKKTLERFAKETGGRFFEFSKKTPIDQIYSEIGEDLRNQVNVAYSPQRGDTSSSGYHKIQLTAKKKDLVVQAREGYYSAK